MANNRSSTHPISADFSALLHANFKQLNSLPIFDVDFLDKDNDWFLLCFLREQQRNGRSFEVTLSGLNSIVGVLADTSYFRSVIDNKIGFLNQNHHLIGESASNKSSTCQEISLALKTICELFPGRYSSLKKTNLDLQDDENNDNKTKKKLKNEEYSMVMSNATEVGLLNNLAKVNTILLHADGDAALNKLGYYDQGKNETSAGVSLFCDASDGIFGGFIRGTGVSQVKIDRPVALLNMLIASTGSKLASMLQRFYDTKDQDGVYGRVFFTWCQSISELPMAKTISFTNVPSFSHFAYAVAQFFVNQFEFRHLANKSDTITTNNDYIRGEERLIQERDKQKVTTRLTYSTCFDENDIQINSVNGTNDNDEQMSSFKLFKILLDDWWKASNSAEHHLKPVLRKVVNMLSKCIWSMKIVRIIFRLMGENLNSINQQQGDRTTLNSTCIDVEFQHAIQISINNYLSTECQETGHQHYIMWSNNNDIVVGYNWYSRKMLVVETLLTLKLVSDVITERAGKKQLKNHKNKQYLTSNKKGPGSGCLSHSNDLKPDQILLPLYESGLIIGGNFIKNARGGNEDLPYTSFCKQLPGVICNNPRIKQAFDNLNLNMESYELTFEHQRLPLGMEFLDEAIDFMKNNNHFVQYYHNYYKEDSRFKSFREMIDERIRLAEIVQNEDNICSNDLLLVNSNQQRNIHDKNFASTNSIIDKQMVTTADIIEASSVQTNCKSVSESSIKNIFLNTQIQIIDQDVDVTCQEQGTTADSGNEVEQQSIQIATNLDADLASKKQLSPLHESANAFDGNTTTESSTKGSSSNIVITGTQNVKHDHLNSLFEISQSQHQDERFSLNATVLPQNDPLKDLTNTIETRLTDIDNQNFQKRNKRGRPNSTNTTSQKWSMEEVNNVIVDPKSSSIWKSILIKRQFILGTLTDLFKMIPSKLFNEDARLKLVEFLIFKKILLKDNWFCDAKGNPIAGYMKGSPADPPVSLTLADFNIDIEEYKRSLNVHQNVKRIIDGKIINRSYLYSSLLQEHIKNDEWFKNNLEINVKFMYVRKEPLQTTSNYQIDQFQKEQKKKVHQAMINQKRKVDELQTQTSMICGSDIPAKRKRKPKIYDD
ncbi:unnamed protein product [Rotaria socialis]|uniref:Uncharacterized protein n=1 Tax=Rotaria socialis TaxID=392032 RepID=A0A821Q7N1_9BILA|nr:unnamed protein product [Rotaria socialis]